MENNPLPPISETAEARLPSTIYEDENTDESGKGTVGLENDRFSIWNQDGWELTWPIWHLLPHDERKRLAHHHGYNTIGEFEEYMSLHQAMDDSESTKPYANERIYPKESSSASRTKTKISEEDSKPAAVAKGEEDDEEDESDSDEKTSYARQSSAATDDLTYDELLQVGGQILMLHDEILHQVFAWLPVDAYATLAMVSPHWKHLSRTEAVYKRLCERLYLNQSKRRQLHVSRFGGSYRTMLEERPRVRAAGGCYILKYAQLKQIQRDMWTEVS